MIQPGIRWTSHTLYVDIDTGEQISKHKAERYYITIKTNKHGKVNDIGTKGTIEYTKQCTRNPQKRLFD